MSSQLQWELIKTSSCYRLKDKKTGTSFSREPYNITGRNSYKFNGLVHKKCLGVYPSRDHKGVMVVYKKGKKFERRPGKMFANIKLPNRDPRKVYKSIRKGLDGMNYRKDLMEFAVRRASMLLRRQQQPSRRLKKIKVPAQTAK